MKRWIQQDLKANSKVAVDQARTALSNAHQRLADNLAAKTRQVAVVVREKDRLVALENETSSLNDQVLAAQRALAGAEDAAAALENRCQQLQQASDAEIAEAMKIEKRMQIEQRNQRR